MEDYPMIKKYFAVAALACVPAFAQHEHQMPMPMPAQPQPQHEHMQMPMPAQPDVARDFLMQQASGTSENPSAAPMHMSMTTFDKWMLMFHGQAFLNQVVQTGARGADGLFSTNWVMGTAERPLAGGHLMLRSMLSFEPLTVRKRGYPE